MVVETFLILSLFARHDPNAPESPVGGKKTFDASTCKPSEARQLIGDASIGHSGDPHDHVRRHSITSPKTTLEQYGPGHQ